MIKSRVQIGDGPIVDFFEEYGFIYLDADERTEAPIKKRDASSYAEEPGEHVDTRTVADAFDYTAQFLIVTPNRYRSSANAKIAAFNRAIYEPSKNSNIRQYKRITFFNLHNRAKIVGIPEPIAVPTEFYRRSDGSVEDCVKIELKLRVDQPQLCDFNYGYIDELLLESGGKLLLENGMSLMLE